MGKYCDLQPESGFDVILKTKRSEAATMVLKGGKTTGGPDNKHQNSDQWMYVTEGKGEIVIEGESTQLKPGRLVLIEAGKTHEVKNTASEDLKTLNIYAPPEYSQ